ncbi:MAG: ABC transporter permease, partial [Cyclobacteriaceae bacterium]|nr:ABC transporter permease [Cyclobacteriaceae bacterium]
MYRNIVIALRSLSQNRFYSLVTILGLSIALSSIMLIYLFVDKELSYDTFHPRYEDIYRIDWISENPQTRTPHPMAEALRTD